MAVVIDALDEHDVYKICMLVHYGWRRKFQYCLSSMENIWEHPIGNTLEKECWDRDQLNFVLKHINEWNVEEAYDQLLIDIENKESYIK
jgi:hypothetical protein